VQVAYQREHVAPRSPNIIPKNPVDRRAFVAADGVERVHGNFGAAPKTVGGLRLREQRKRDAGLTGPRSA
jgi:hypothetical protein